MSAELDRVNHAEARLASYVDGAEQHGAWPTMPDHVAAVLAEYREAMDALRAKVASA